VYVVMEGDTLAKLRGSPLLRRFFVLLLLLV